MFCLTCRYASPVGAIFCGRCGRGFGARICTSGHACPPASRFCTTCRKPESELSESTGYIPIGWATKLLAWSAMLGCLQFAVRHASEVMAATLAAAMWLAAHMLGVSQGALVGGLYRAVWWLIAIYLLSFLLPGSVGQSVRRVIAFALSRLPRVTWAVVRILLMAMRLIVDGRSSKDKSDKKKG